MWIIKGQGVLLATELKGYQGNEELLREYVSVGSHMTLSLEEEEKI